MTEKRSKADSIRRIIDAARDEFARHGYAGARVDAIAERAGVNKALLYYHIGDKAALYEGVLHDIFGDAAGLLSTMIQTLPDPVEKLRAYIRSFLGIVRKHPQLPSIMLRELAGNTRNLPGRVVDDLARILELLGGILEEGADAGVFRETSPAMIHFMVIGPAVYYARVAPLKDRFARRMAPGRMQKNFDVDVETEIERLILRAIINNQEWTLP